MYLNPFLMEIETILNALLLQLNTRYLWYLVVINVVIHDIRELGLILIVPVLASIATAVGNGEHVVA